MSKRVKFRRYDVGYQPDKNLVTQPPDKGSNVQKGARTPVPKELPPMPPVLPPRIDKGVFTMNKDCSNCKNSGRPSYDWPCTACGVSFLGNSPSKWEPAEHYQPPTKAERLRVKTDRELAKYLVEIGWDCHLCSEHERLENEPLLRGEKCDNDCAKHCLEWLQQPAEEE